MNHFSTIKNSQGKIPIPFIPIDAVGIKARSQSFTRRSIKKESKLFALKLAVSMVDLTTLEGADTDHRIEDLCIKAINPVPHSSSNLIEKKEYQELISSIPSVAAVCVYPQFVAKARSLLNHSKVQVASVATGFPSGQIPEYIKIQEVENAVHNGAHEIDMVLDRGAFLSGNYQKVFDEIYKIKQICEGKSHLKVILETGDLETFENIRLASWIAMEAGADFIKTSTGKISSAANLDVTLVMLLAIWDYYQSTGKKIGMKPAGGIRSAKQAIQYLVMVNETLGSQWLSPKLFRFGASSLLNDLLRQIFKQTTGHYFYSDIFSND